MKRTRIVHLHFHELRHEKQDYFFGSLKAIFDLFTREDIGISYNSIVAKHRDFYENSLVRINFDELITHEQKNKKADYTR